VPPEAGPQADDLSSVHYPYFSTVDYVTNQYSGLIGVVVITSPATLTAQGAPRLRSCCGPAGSMHAMPRAHQHPSNTQKYRGCQKCLTTLSIFTMI
jgi:hypothetical protein